MRCVFASIKRGQHFVANNLVARGPPNPPPKTAQNTSLKRHFWRPSCNIRCWDTCGVGFSGARGVLLTCDFRLWMFFLVGSMEFPKGSLNRWDRWYISPQLAGTIPLTYHLYIAYWVTIYHLPPVKGTRNSCWLVVEPTHLQKYDGQNGKLSSPNFAGWR